MLQEVDSVLEDRDLDLEELSLYFGRLNLVTQAFALSQGVLVVFHAVEVFFDLDEGSLQVGELFLLASLQRCVQRDLLIVTLLLNIVKGDFFVLVDLMLIVGLFRVLQVVVELSGLSLELHLLVDVQPDGLIEAASFVARLLLELLLHRFQFLHLLLDYRDLGVKHEALAFDLERLLGQLLHLSVEIFAHLRVLSLEQAYVLVRALVIVVEASDTRLCLVLIHLLLQNLEFQRHEVNLLLQIDDVLIGSVFVRVLAEHPRLRRALLLAPELHLVD